MPRKRFVAKREVLPDPKYGNRELAKFINMVMSSGKKSIAERIVYGALDQVAQKGKSDKPLEMFSRALENIRPLVEVKSRRVGGASYQVPVEIRPIRQMALAFRWIKQSAESRAGRSMQEKLAAELLDAANNTGAAVKKRDEVHRMAEANRAFAHYRW